MFRTVGEFLASLEDVTQPDTNARDLARVRQGELTKPTGSLGRLEELAIWLAGWQGRTCPIVSDVEVLVFAGNHGVVARGVSPYPSAVTAQMVANFENGGAAINALCDEFGHRLKVLPLSLDAPTADISLKSAMSDAECLAALNAGVAAVSGNIDALILGEMGIGNTTVAAALAAATYGGNGAQWAGPGTGLDDNGVRHKAAIIDEALALHREHCRDPFSTLRHLGGRELAAIVGAIVEARRHRIPVVLDGYVVTAAAATLTKANPHALTHCIAGHVSAEPAHKHLLRMLQMKPLLDLSMRLGEGTGATLAITILRAAVATHGEMSTFAEAGVSDRED